MVEIRNNKIFVNSEETKNPLLIGYGMLDMMEEINEKVDLKYSKAKDILKNHIKQTDLRNTPERYAILETVFKIKSFDIDAIYQRMHEKYYRVSKATIYNAVALFAELNIVFRTTYSPRPNTWNYSIKKPHNINYLQ